MVEENITCFVQRKGENPLAILSKGRSGTCVRRNSSPCLKAGASLREFREELKLTLSNKKTLITDVRTKKVKFLGFCLEAKKRRFHKEGLAVKMIPDMEKVHSKLKEIKRDIRFLRTRKTEIEKALDIEKINAKIVGLSNHLKIGISKKVMSKIDCTIEETAYRTWVKMYGKEKAAKYKVPVSQFNNRVDRHKGYRMKHFSVVTEDGIRVGLTFAKITAIEYAKVFKQEMTPYTVTGRRLYEERANKKAQLLARPHLTDPEWMYIYLTSKHRREKYNLEYFLNREYAFNRDKGKCKICGCYLHPGNYHCHHIDPHKLLNQVNKVSNLASLCKTCHNLVHNDQEPPFKERNMTNKLAKYREKVKAPKSTS